MSAIEAGPQVSENDQLRSQRTALEVYVGEQLLAGSQPEPFIRRRIEAHSQQDVRTLWQGYFVGYSTLTANGQFHREFQAADDEFSRRRFSSETGVNWDAATVWTIDSPSD